MNLIIDSNQISSASPSVSGRSTPKGSIIDKPVGTGKKRGRPSKAVMKEREEAKRARGELPEELPKEKVPKRRGRKPKIDWASMSEEVIIRDIETCIFKIEFYIAQIVSAEFQHVAILI